MQREQPSPSVGNDLQISLRPARPHEHDAVRELVERRFPSGDRASSILATTLERDPRFQAEHLRIAEVDGDLAGMMLLIDRVVRIGTALVRCGIVAPVATAHDYAGQGVCSALMRDGLAWAAHAGFHLSMLWGHSWLYPRYGYAPALKRYSVILPTDLRPGDDSGYTLRGATAADAPALAACYYQTIAMTTLAELRSGEPWEWRPSDAREFVEVTLDPIRSVRGYFRAVHETGRISVHEIAVLDDRAAQALTDRLLHLAAEAGGSTVHVNATPENLWSRWAFMRGASYLINGGDRHGMVRVLDIARFFQAMQPELERRVGHSEYIARNGRVRLETPIGSIGISVEAGKVRFDDGRGAPLATLPWSMFGALVTGYRSVEDFVGLPGVRVEGEHTLRLLHVLFPEGAPHWSAPAYF